MQIYTIFYFCFIYELGTTSGFSQESQHFVVNLIPAIATTKTVTLKYEYGIYVNLDSNNS